MDYKKMMGYGDKKKVTKKQSKPKKNQVLEGIKSELNEWNDRTFKNAPKRWTGAIDKGLTEYETLKEGPAYEYRKPLKTIEGDIKSLSVHFLDFYELLRDKKLDKEASALLQNYKKNIVTFKKTFDKIARKLI